MKRYQVITNDCLVICVTADNWMQLVQELREQNIKPISIVELSV